MNSSCILTEDSEARPMVCDTCVWAGWDSLREQEKLKARVREMLDAKRAAESHTSARFVNLCLSYQPDLTIQVLPLASFRPS